MKKYWLFLVYVAVSLLIGKEFHPFSTFPMYNSFPNWGYVFLLKNERNEIVSYGKNFKDGQQKNAGYVGHTFYSFMEQNHYPYGYGKEDTAQLHQAGAVLMQMVVKGEVTDTFHFDTLKLYRRFYFLKNEQLNYRDDLLYAQPLRP